MKLKIQRTTITCDKCGQEISRSNYTKHLRRHELHPETFNSKSYALNHDGLDCQFCNKHFSNRNSLCNHERLCNKNPNRQPSPLIAYNASKECAWNKGLTKETDPRVAKSAESIKAYYKDHDGSWTGKHHTEEEKAKIGAGVKAYLEANPENVPYLRNHSSKESKAEEYFRKVFETERIILKQEYPLKSYHLDFAEPNKKIDIEIDGDQHRLDPTIVAHDKKRDAEVSALGWKVHRILWSDYQKKSRDEREKVIQEIRDLIERN